MNHSAIKVMSIKQVAQLSEVGIETVRFYERGKLIPAPPRTPAGYRQYSPDAVTRIKFIKRAQGLGFSLPEIKELLALRVARNTKPEDIRKRTKIKIADIDLKIRTLQHMKKTLEQITAACVENEGTLKNCPILKAFEEDDYCKGRG